MKTLFAGLVAAATVMAGIGIASTDGLAQKKSAAPKKVLILFKGQNFEGQSYEVVKLRSPIMTEFPVGSFMIAPGDTWIICDAPSFKGNCNTYTESQSGLGAVNIQSAKLVKPPKAPKAPKA